MIRKEKRIRFYHVLFVCLLFLLVLNLSSYVKCEADKDPDDFDDCHLKGDYSISSESKKELTVDRGEKFYIDITGEGPDVILKFNPISVDNDHFKVEPTNLIDDNSKYDEASKDDEIYVNFTLVAPDEIGVYRIMFYVRSPDNSPLGNPYIDFIVFNITVEKPTQPNHFEVFFNAVFDHYNIYLGGIAIGSLLIGTILYQIDFRKYSRTHGMLSAVSLVFTSINVYFILTESLLLLILWLNPLAIDWIHLLHFALGIIGYVACIIAALSGISGLTHKKWGYIALACWGFNFAFGLIWWGIGLV